MLMGLGFGGFLSGDHEETQVTLMDGQPQMKSKISNALSLHSAEILSTSIRTKAAGCCALKCLSSAVNPRDTQEVFAQLFGDVDGTWTILSSLTPQTLQTSLPSPVLCPLQGRAGTAPLLVWLCGVLQALG